MTKLKGIFLLILLYLITFFSIKYNINILYPYYYIKDLIIYPVIATNTSSITFDKSVYENIIKEKNDDIEELKKLKDISNVNSDYLVINATIIERNRNYWFNSFTINKGSRDGIELDMAVINNEGLIGRINKVNPYTSEVKLITTNDTNSKISFVINKDNHKYYGIINGYDNELGLIGTLLDKDINLNESDVITTGMGGIFPSGILIGKVTNTYLDHNEVSYLVNIKPSTNISSLKYVSILKREE